MSVDPTKGQEPTTTGQAPADTTTATTTTPPVGQEPPKAETFDVEYVKQLRSEAAANRKKAAEAEAKLKEHEDAKLGETERLTKQVAELTAKAEAAERARQEALIRAAIDREAHKQGAVDADAVFALVDRSAVSIGDDGAVGGADKAVKALLEAKPFLKAPAGNGTAAVPATGKANGQAPTREQLVNDKLEKLRASGSYSRL